MKEIMNKSNSVIEVLKEFGLSGIGGGSRNVFYKYVKENNLEKELDELKERVKLKHSAFLKSYGVKKASFEECFCENSKVARHSVKNKIIKEHLIEYKCSFCGNIGEWNGSKLVLQLDHINGINNDNRLENLRFLCPNCHSQTKTYSGKNNK